MLGFVFVPVLFQPHEILEIGALQEGVMGAFVANRGKGCWTIIMARIHFDAHR